MSTRAQEVADELIGSTRDLNSILTEDEQQDQDLLDDINELAVLCETCGWWVASEDVDEDGNCDECHHEEEIDNER